MEQSWKFFLFMTFFCLIAQAFFAMVEMACVSFNKVRLQYYVSKNRKRAIWVRNLIARPALLFGTSMLGVNTAMLLGSECARRFYLSLDLSPDWAALSQVVLVVVLGEISPMFAGRRYAESAAMLGIGILYGVSIVLRPVIWGFNLLCEWINRLTKAPKEGGFLLTREELQKVLEERDDITVSTSPREFDTVVQNIFSLKNKTAQELMQPLKLVPNVASFCTVGEIRSLLASGGLKFLSVYHRDPKNIVGIVYPRDLLRERDEKKGGECAKQPWFITQNSSILEILKQFRYNNQIVAIVLGPSGQAVGMLTLDEIIDEIFGQTDLWSSIDESISAHRHIVVDRTFSGDTLLADLKARYHIELHFQDAMTLEELCEQILGHIPAKGDAVKIGHFELTVEEAPLLGVKMIAVRTLQN